MSMSKKGSALDAMRMFTNIVLVSLIIAFIAVVVFWHLDETIEPGNLQQQNLFQTAIYQCLAYEDSLGIHPGQIDPDKINDGRLQSCINLPKSGYKISLKDLDGNTLKKSVYRNGGNYDEDKFIFCTAIDGYICGLFKQPITYKQGNDFLPGVIEMEVISIE
jgi:hypothetical protein